MTVWDVFPYWRERWAVDARLRLWAGVDNYNPLALVGDRTFRGQPLELVEPGIQMTRVVLDAGGPWEREHQQRNAVYALKAGLDPDDLLLLTDADEFVDPAALPQILEATESGPVKLRMAMYACGTRWRNPGLWKHAAACRVRDLPEKPSEQLRSVRSFPGIDDAGWHLSFFGSDEDVDAKLRAFAHEDHDTPAMRADLVRLRETGNGWLDDPLTGPLADALAAVVA